MQKGEIYYFIQAYTLSALLVLEMHDVDFSNVWNWRCPWCWSTITSSLLHLLNIVSS